MQKCSWWQPFSHSPSYFDYRIQEKKIKVIFTLEIVCPLVPNWWGQILKDIWKCISYSQSHILITFVGLNVNPKGGTDQAVSLIKVSERVLSFKRLHLWLFWNSDVRAHVKSLFLHHEVNVATTWIRVSLQYFTSKIIRHCMLVVNAHVDWGYY